MIEFYRVPNGFFKYIPIYYLEIIIRTYLDVTSHHQREVE